MAGDEDGTPLAPLRPCGSSRPSSGGRSHHRRYVVDSAYKLGDDAARAASRLRSDASTASPSPLLAANSAAESPYTPDLAGHAAAAAELWRCAFHTEATETVRSMAAVADSAKLLHFGGRFEEWRKTDLKATAVLQQHVKELSRLTQFLDRFLDDSSPSGNLADFKGCLRQLRLLNGHVEDQRLRWADLDVRLDQLKEQVKGVGDLVRRQGEQMETLETAQHAGEQMALLATAVRDMGHTNGKALTDFAGRIREGTEADIEALKGHFRAMLDDGGAIRRAMDALDTRLHQWDAVTKAETARWKAQAEELEHQLANLQEMARSAKTWQSNAEQAHSKCAKLDQEVQGLEGKLGEMQEALAAAAAMSFSSGMRRLKELEHRGHVQVNRQTGEIVLLKQVDFLLAKPTDKDPSAEFLSAETAAAVLKDIADVAGIFGGVVEVEVHNKAQKGATPAFWDEVADKCASLAREALLRSGMPPEQLMVKSFAGPKGRNDNCIVAHLDRQLFAEDRQARKPGAAPKKLR